MSDLSPAYQLVNSQPAPIKPTQALAAGTGNQVTSTTPNGGQPIYFLNASGQPIPVSIANPLPVRP